MLAFLLTITDNEYLDTIKKIYHLYHNDMIKFAYSLLKKRGAANPRLDCEDAVQNAYYKIIRYGKIDMTRSDTEIRSYLYTVVVNECYLIMKEQKKWQELDEADECPSDEDFIALISIKDEYDRVVRIISELEPIYSTTLYQCLVKEIKPAEVAKMLGVSINTVNTRLRRGKQKVLKALGGEQGDK